MMADRQRLRRWSRGLVALTLVGLVVVVIAFQPALHWILERELTSALGAPVRIGRLRVSPFAGRLQITDLSIRDKQSGRSLLSIRGVGVDVSLRALTRRELLVTRLGLDAPEAWLTLTPTGFSRLSLPGSSASTSSSLVVTLQEVAVSGGKIHLVDRRRTPERREVIDGVEIRLRDLSTGEDRRETHEAIAISGRWRGMSISAQGWMAPFARRRAFHLPLRITHADLGQVAAVLPPRLLPAELAGKAEVAMDVSGQEAGRQWQVQAGLRIAAERVSARPRPTLVMRSGSLRVEGEGHWNPRGLGFSRLTVDVASAAVEVDGRLQASVDRLTARGQADLDQRGLAVPAMTTEVSGLSLGRSGEPPMLRIGRMEATGGTDQHAGTARLERIRLADVSVRVVRQADGSLDAAEWIGAMGGGTAGEGQPLAWEVSRLEVDRASLDITDRTSLPERSLAIRNARLRLRGATSDPLQPIRFFLVAETSLAPTVRLRGRWVRAPMELQAQATVQEANLPGLREWLPATLPVDIPSGQADLTLQADVRTGQDGVTGEGAVDLRLRNIQVQSDQTGSLAATDLALGLKRIRVAGRGQGGLSVRVEGEVRGTTVSARLGERESPAPVEASADNLQMTLGRMGLVQRQGGTRLFAAQTTATVDGLRARAPGCGLDSLGTTGARMDVSRLIARLGPGGLAMEMAGRVSVARTEGRTPGLPVRTWSAAGVRADVDRLQTAPFQLHLGALEVDQPEVDAVRAESAASGSVFGLGGGALPPVHLDRLVVRNGRVRFRDEAVRPTWTSELSDVEAVAEGLQTERDIPVSFRLSAKERDGAEARLTGRVQPLTWTGEIRAELDNMDVLRPAPYLPDAVHRVVRGGTASGALDLKLRRNGQALQVMGSGHVSFSPLELGDVRRQLTFLLAETVRARVEEFSLDPLGVRVGSVTLERPWIVVGQDRDGTRPILRLVNELRQSSGVGEGASHGEPGMSVQVLTISNGTLEIEDRAVRPFFRDQVQRLEMAVEDLTTEEARKAHVSITGELSDRSTVALQGFILPLPSNLYVDLEGDVRDFNLHRLNPYTARLTSYRLEQGKLTSHVHYRVEENRLEGENLFRIDQLALGEQVEPVDRFEELVGLPLALAISLLQDSSGEIILRVPVHGDLDKPEFDLAEVIGSAIRNALVQLIEAPFRLIGQILTFGGKIGAIEIDPVRFAPGSYTLDAEARAHLATVAAILRNYPSMKIKLTGMAHVESDEDAIRAQRLDQELQKLVREPGVKDREDAVDRLFLRTFGASTGKITREDKYARLKAAQRVSPRDVRDLPDARALSLYDYLSAVEKIERDRLFLADGKVTRTAEGGGDQARRAEISLLQP